MTRFLHPAPALIATIGLLGASGTAWSEQKAPPPIVVVPSNARTLIQWEPGPIRCDGAVLAGRSTVRRPWNQLGWTGGDRTRSLTIRFAIDATGRPVSIGRGGTDYVPYGDDVAPALAASRFAAQAPHQDCSVTYTMRSSTMAEAAVPELISYTIHPLSGRLPEEGWSRIHDAGGDCQDEPRPQPLEQHYPDFSTIPATPGVRDWSMIRYDIDASGRVRAPEVLTGTGNRALEAAGVKAMRESRFTQGPRKGCLYPYWRMAAKLPAPDMPEAIRLTKVPGNCPDQHGWAVPPQLRFPEPYRRRSIEGWAVIRYDVAPWGETGNWSVIEAQPSADFGAQAIAMIRAARLPTSGQGYTGCVDRVRFNMGPNSPSHLGGEGGAPVPAS